MNLWRKIKNIFTNNDHFLHTLEELEEFVSKILSVFMIVVILVCIYQLVYFLIDELFVIKSSDPINFTKKTFQIFGLFLNILIALELLENITAYLKKHIIQIELVLVTSLIAIARKIILLDLEKVDGLQMIGLAIAIFSLSISYLIVKKTNVK
jgi:uncharacterized membrane protein (DUF373 family)